MTNPNVVDLTPTWRQILPGLVCAAVNGETPEGRQMAMGELYRLADIVDAHGRDCAILRGAATCPSCGTRGAK